MRTFEFNGEKYALASRHQKEWGGRLISGLSLRGGESILDLGCGDGALTEQLALLVPDGTVLGIDASQGMINAAEKHTQDNLKFMRADINRLNFANTFDVIFSNAALHWVKDHDLLLKNALSALKPGGVISWNFAGDGTCSRFFEVIREKMASEPYRAFFRGFVWPWYMPLRQDYEEKVRAAGFSEFSVLEEKADRFFADSDEMIQWLDQPTLVPFMDCVPPALKADFRNDVIEAMLHKTQQLDGACCETFRRIKVTAVK